MVFHGILSDSKSPQVSKTLLSILADLNNAVVWMVSTCSLISKSSSPFINPLRIVPCAPIHTRFICWSLRVTRTIQSILADFSSAVVWSVSIIPLISSSPSLFFKTLRIFRSAQTTIGITVTFMFHRFFSSLARSKYLSFHFPLFLSLIRWNVTISFVFESPREFSWTDSGLCIYDLSAWSNFYLSHNFQWITYPTLSCLVLCPFCTSLLHSLMVWWTVSSLSLHSLNFLFINFRLEIISVAQFYTQLHLNFKIKK